MSLIIKNLNDLRNQYSLLFCDVWGCVHNGIEAFKSADLALTAFRKSGGIVVLLTNAPRPAKAVKRQLDKIGLSDDSYDHIVTAGDAALEFIKKNNLGKKIYHVGPAKDKSFFDTLFSTSGTYGFSLTPLQKADFIVCTGLFNDQTETPENYRSIFKRAKAQKLSMICTNPDVFVDFGEKRLFCAGALALSYKEIGGEVYSFGKPFDEIYNFARKLLRENNVLMNDTEILCIGDGIHTDIKGANNQKIHSLFIANGLEKENLINQDGLLDESKLENFLKKKSEKPDFVIENLK